MLSKALALTSVAALAGQSLALSAHRRLHQQADKRALEVVYETVWYTVYASDCCASATLPALPALPDAAPTHHGHALRPDSTRLGASIATTTSTLTLPVSLPVSLGPAPSAPAATPSQQSTMITVVHSTSAPTSASASASASSPPPVSHPASVPSSSAPPTSSQSATSSSAAQPSQPVDNTGMSAQSVGSKRGMAYNDANLANAFGEVCKGCSWLYNWGTVPGPVDPKYNYIPMLWGPDPNHSDGFDAAAQQAIAKGDAVILGFNEPDNAGQSNLPPDVAAASHHQFMDKYRGQARIGSPAVTNSNLPGQGVQWLTSFMAACNALEGGCPVDFCVTHWYSPAEAYDTLFQHLEQVHQACGGKDVMLTEFAPFGDDNAIDAFLRRAIPQLEAIPYLSGYSYFMVKQGSLMADANTPSTYGRTYATL